MQPSDLSRIFYARQLCDKLSCAKPGPRLTGAVQILSTVPTVNWVLLGSGESNKG